MKKIFAMFLIVAAVGLYAVPTFTIAKSTNADDEILTINDERQAVSDGRMFFATNSFSTTSQGFYIVTGGIAPRISMSVLAFTADTVSMTFYESVSMGSSTGTVMDIFNVNRNSSNDPTLKISHSPSVLTTYTTQLPTLVLSVGPTVAQRDYSNPMATSGWILKKQTAYYVKLTPATASAFPIAVRFGWKE